jgi:thiamine biosynthesis lipoprotein
MDGSRPLRLGRLGMRTRFELVLADQGDPAHLRAAGEEALDEIGRAESRLSAFQDGADLRRINALAAQEPVRVDPPTSGFLRSCLSLADATGGAFDLAVGALLDLWRIQGDGDDQPAPSAAAITEALGACDLRRQLVLDEAQGTVRLAHARTRLDPGAVGKGWALDRALALLRGHGVHDALLHGGTSTVQALGDEPGRSGWTIAIRHPVLPSATIASATLHDRSLSVSGQHGRTLRRGGRTIGHIVDPRSGAPVDGNLLAAVIHPSALVSDALSTALLVLGGEGLALLRTGFPDASLLLARAVGEGIAVDTAGSGFTRGDADAGHEL